MSKSELCCPDCSPESQEHGGNNPVVEEGSNATTGWVGDNSSGAQDGVYGGSLGGSLSDDPNVPANVTSQEDEVIGGTRVQLPVHNIPGYGHENVNIRKEFISIPLCNGKPVGTGIRWSVHMNPGRPEATSISINVVNFSQPDWT